MNYAEIKKYIVFTIEFVESIDNSIKDIDKDFTIDVYDVSDYKIYLDYTVKDLDILMKYHGTNRVTITNDEPPYFYRNEQKIYLFNNHSMSYIEKIKNKK